MTRPPVDESAHPWASRFADRVEVREDGCWEWVGMRDTRYGRFYAGGGVDAEKWAHRRSYEMFVGPIPDGLELDHLCRFTFCVNPAHLEPVTRSENQRRAVAAREPAPHATATRYHSGCRCVPCSQAHHDYAVARRAEKRRLFAAGLIEIEHGTRHGYAFYLCRCESCSAAGLADAERNRRARGVKPRPVPQHGTTTMYTKYRCRCEPCRSNWSEYWRAHRAQKRGEAA